MKAIRTANEGDKEGESESEREGTYHVLLFWRAMPLLSFRPTRGKEGGREGGREKGRSRNRDVMLIAL